MHRLSRREIKNIVMALPTYRRHFDCCYYQVNGDLCWNDKASPAENFPQCHKCKEYDKDPWDFLQYYEVMQELFKGEIYRILRNARNKRDFALWNYVQTRKVRKIPTIVIKKKPKKNWIAML